MTIYKCLFIILFWIEFCCGAGYTLELDCSTTEQCNAILAAIAAKFREEANATANLTFKDYNECEDTLNFCVAESNTKCSNVLGTFSCECGEGYMGNVSFGTINCSDIDECSNSTLNDCSAEEQCMNVEGGFDCRCTRPDSTGEGRCITDATLMPLLVTSIAESPDSLSEVSTSSATEDLSNITIESSASGSGTEATEDVFFTFPETQFPSNGSQDYRFYYVTDVITTSQETPSTTAHTIALQTDTTSLPTDTTTLQTDTTSLPTDTTTLQTDTTSVPTDTTTLQTDTTSVPTDTTTLQTDTTSVPTDTITLQTETTSFQTDTTSYHTESNGVPADGTSFPEITSLRTDSTVFPTSADVLPPNTTVVSTSTTTSAMDMILGPISVEDILAGNVSVEDAINIVSNISSLIENSTIDESLAVTIVGVFDLFAASPGSFPSSALVDITQLAEQLLLSMVLRNGSFMFNGDQVSAAAIDVDETQTEPLFYSVFSGFDSAVIFPPFISLPAILFDDSEQQRISFTGYDNAGLFPSEKTTVVANQSFDFKSLNGDLIINSGVIGSALNGTEVLNLRDPILITLPVFVSVVDDDVRENSTVVRRSLYNPRCVFFNYSLNNGAGDWSSDGCITNPLTGTNNVTCQCNHLTSFAVLMSVETRIDDHILTILTYVGCSLSIFGLLISILSYTIFRNLRKHKSKQILVHFCIALTGVYIVYIFGITAALPANQTQCTASGFFLHFFTTSTFAWMFIEVLDMYLMFVKVWNEISHPVKKACAFGWGFPLLLSLATLSAHLGLQNRYPGQNAPRLYPEFRATTTCWLTPVGLYWAFFLPMGIVLAVNVILFVIVLYHVTCKRANSKLTRNHSNSRRIKARQHILNAVAILLLSGPTWIVGFLINIDPVSDGTIRRILAYIFVIFNAFQGLWIFIVFTVRPQTVRSAWWGLLSGKSGFGPSSSGGTSWGRRMTKTSSTYLSRANKRKSSADIRRSSASSSVSAFKIHSSGKLRKLEVNNHFEKSNGNAKQYRYNTPNPVNNSSSDQSSSYRKDSAESQQNLVLENLNGVDNQTFNNDERSSTSSN